MNAARSENPGYAYAVGVGAFPPLGRLPYSPIGPLATIGADPIPTLTLTITIP